MSKSANKKTRLYVQAMPLGPDLAQTIDDADAGARGFAIRSRLLADTNSWDADEARKIWCFGPDDTGSNVLVNATNGNIPYMNEIKDGASSAFQWATKEGALAEEPMRAVLFNIVDYTVARPIGYLLCLLQQSRETCHRNTCSQRDEGMIVI